jgi:very-short-patch-repair endonuclease
MNVYLAGKITRSCWRHQYVDGLEEVGYDTYHNERWPILKKAIRDTLDYCGPFFFNAGHGMSHGESTHGQQEINSLPLDEKAQENVFRRCFEAMEIADAMIAYVTPDSYGTLIELGWFRRMAQYSVSSKHVFVISSKECFTTSNEMNGCCDSPAGCTHCSGYSDYHRNDLWFASLCTDRQVESVDEAIQILCEIETADELLSKCESPVELMFYQAYRQECRRINAGIVLCPQIEVGRYRLDFGCVELKIGFEIDGHNYHSTKEQLKRDMQRQRALAEMGWTIHRFTGSEIYNNATECAKQANRLLGAKKVVQS